MSGDEDFMGEDFISADILNGDDDMGADFLSADEDF
jgi:hypothetical protein